MEGISFDPQKAFGIVLYIGGLIISFFFGFASRNILERPKLTNVGGGGGGSEPISFYVKLENRPGRIGFYLEETVLFGRLIHRSRAVGPLFDRKIAHECRGRIIEEESGDLIGALCWRMPDGNVQQVVTLKSGETADLLLLARLRDEPSKYFVYQHIGKQDQPFIAPDDSRKFDSSKSFRIEVRDKYEFVVYRANVKIKKLFGGRFQYHIDGGGGGSL